MASLDQILSAPSSSSEIHILTLVILIVSVFSALGAGWIILSFSLFERLRSFRHELILGLAISDFWMAINFLSSASMILGGRIIGGESQKTFCSFNGFMIQVFVVQTDYWVLTIAVCTYLILADHKSQSAWIQEHRSIIWILPWFFSILWAAVGLAIVGYGDIGVWCWFTSDRIRLLVNFVPRFVIVVAILALYGRLYFIIHTAHNRFMSFDEDNVESLQTNSSAARSAQGISMSVFSGADGRCERSERTLPVHSRPRIGGTPPALKRISYQMMTYPLIYMLIWTIPASVRIYQATTGKPASFGIATIDKACIVIQGFADAVVYGFNEHTWKLWRGVFRRNKSDE